MTFQPDIAGLLLKEEPGNCAFLIDPKTVGFLVQKPKEFLAIKEEFSSFFNILYLIDPSIM